MRSGPTTCPATNLHRGDCQRTAGARRAPARPGVLGFTLIELLVVIIVLAILAGLLLPVIAMARNAVRSARTQTQITGLTGAIELYALEDGRRRFPPTEADDSIRTARFTGGAPRALDLLAEDAFSWRREHLDIAPGSSGPDRLCDGWGRPLRYRTDAVVDGSLDRPAPRDDWNPKGREPYAYVWSLGRPGGDDAADADPTNADRWLYRSGAQ